MIIVDDHSLLGHAFLANGRIIMLAPYLRGGELKWAPPIIIIMMLMSGAYGLVRLVKKKVALLLIGPTHSLIHS